jgi:DNA/RNA-binding domain of Phe-tRNA-synthetase-like protein
MRYAGEEPEVHEGVVDPGLAAAHPGLTLLWTAADAAPGPTPAELRRRLRAAADRIGGPQAIRFRQGDVAHAHRVFLRHLGIDPDAEPAPAEALMLGRTRQGGLPSRGNVADALAVAALDTGVGVTAFDADAIAGDLELAAAAARPVVRDREGVLAGLFEPPPGRGALGPETRRIALVVIGVPGVPRLAVDEALWIAWDTLA